MEFMKKWYLKFMRQHMLELAGNKKLWMNAYSRTQFSKEENRIAVAENGFQNIRSGEYCFLEDEDPRFAAMMAEAEKYLGYAHVWGGASPSTSFDCSGYVSWVINNCGVGWNFGRPVSYTHLDVYKRQ